MHSQSIASFWKIFFGKYINMISSKNEYATYPFTMPIDKISYYK